MSVVGLIVLVIIAAVAGGVGQALAGYSRGGCLAAIAIGFIGAYLGWWLARTFHLPPFIVVTIDGQAFPLVWAIIGGALFAGLLHLLFGGYRYRRT